MYGPDHARVVELGFVPAVPAARPHDDRRGRGRRGRQGHPHGRVATTRTRPRWASRPPGGAVARRARRRGRDRCGSPPSRPPTSTRPTPPTIHAALRLGRDAAAFDVVGSVRSALGALRAALGSAGASLVVSRRPRAPGCPVVPTRRPAATAPPRCSSATTPTARCSPSSSAWQRHRGVPRPLAHPGRRPLEGVGGALRRDPLRRASASRPGRPR